MQPSTFFGALAVSALLASPVQAATTSYDGTFSTDDEVVLIDFSLSIASNLSIVGFGYGGGLQFDGALVDPGGFDTIFSLFDGAGELVALNDDGDGVNADPFTGLFADSVISGLFGPGDYTLAITQFENFPLGSMLSDGFLFEGDPNFTAFYGCSNEAFCDSSGANRTGNWAVDIDIAPIPLPASLPLLLVGLGAIGLMRRKSKK